MKLKLVLITFLLSGSAFAQQKTILLSGRTVDARNVPISGAIVTLYYPTCRNCIDHILPVSSSLPDGVFFIEHSTSSLKGLKLFVRERIPNGFWSPVDGPPFEKLSHLPQFRGIPIQPRKGRGRVNLGDVIVRIRYGRVMIELPKPLLSQYNSGEELSKQLHFALRDGRGKVIYDGRLPSTAFDPTFSYVRLALTEGKWTLELSIEDHTILKPRLSVEIVDLGCIKLTMNEGKQRQQLCE